MAKLRGGTAELRLETGRWIGLKRARQSLPSMWLEGSGECQALCAEV